MKRRIHTISLYTASSFLVIFIAMYLLVSFKPNINENFESFNVPIIIGNTDTTTLCLSPLYMLNAWYHVERLDSISDTLDLSKPPKDKKGLSYQFYESPPVVDGRLSNAGLRVITDTVNELSMTKKPIWASFLFHRFFSDSAEVLQDDTLIQQVKSFPIYIANLSANYMAKLEVQDGSIMMVVQAVNKDGHWKPIEYWSGSWCGNSYYTLVIPPKHMLMTRGIKCSGDFRTKCRMMVTNERDSIFSNEFYMSINDTQFDSPIRKN